MKTYNSSPSTAKKANFFKRHIYAIALVGTAVVLATVITLSFVLTQPDKPIPADNKPVNTAPTYVMPLENAEILQECVLTRLILQPTLNQWRTHNGIDFIASKGDNVMAVANGTVTSIENTLLEGVVITIDHGEGLKSIYKSLDTNTNVNEGQAVKAGDVIGTVGDPMAIEVHAGTHLHLEMKLNNKFVNPTSYLPSINK